MSDEQSSKIWLARLYAYGVVAIIIALFIGLLTPTISSRTPASETILRNHLRQICQAMLQYHIEFHEPPRLQDLDPHGHPTNPDAAVAEGMELLASSQEIPYQLWNLPQSKRRLHHPPRTLTELYGHSDKGWRIDNISTGWDWSAPINGRAKRPILAEHPANWHGKQVAVAMMDGSVLWAANRDESRSNYKHQLEGGEPDDYIFNGDGDGPDINRFANGHRTRAFIRWRNQAEQP